jgi:hypothetical protein
MKNILSIACIVMLPLLSSCPGRQMTDITCTNGFLQVVGVGFAASDFAGATIVRYKQDNLFDSSIDSGSITLSSVTADTCLLWSHAPYVIAGYDYKMSLPAISKTYLITNITQSVHTHRTVAIRDPPYHCVRKMISCNVNGTVRPIDSSKMDLSLGAADTLYLPK